MLKLKNPERRSKYKESISKKLKEVSVARRVEDRWCNFKETLIGTAKAFYRVSNVMNKGEKVHWWNEEIRQNVEKKMAMARYFRTGMTTMNIERLEE